MKNVAIMLGAALLLAPDLASLVGQCDIVETQDEAREVSGMPPVAHLPGFDDLCRRVRGELGLGDGSGKEER